MNTKEYRAWLKRMKRLFRKIAKPGDYWAIDYHTNYHWMHLYEASGRTQGLIGAWSKQDRCCLEGHIDRMNKLHHLYGDAF
jgi:hypothetical protein